MLMDSQVFYLMAVVVVALVGLCCYFAKMARDTSSAGYRATDRERRDMQDFVSRLIEKQTLSPGFAANMHAIERREQRERDTGLEERAMMNSPAPEPQPRRGDEHNPMDEVME
jgi:hypothetical protein